MFWFPLCGMDDHTLYINIYIYIYINIYIIWIIWLIACVTMFFNVRNMRLWQPRHMWFVNCKNRRWRRGVSLLFQLPLHGLQGLVEIAPKTMVVPQWNVFWFMNVYDDIWSLYQLYNFIYHHKFPYHLWLTHHCSHSIILSQIMVPFWASSGVIFTNLANKPGHHLLPAEGWF